MLQGIQGRKIIKHDGNHVTNPKKNHSFFHLTSARDVIKLYACACYAYIMSFVSLSCFNIRISNSYRYIIILKNWSDVHILFKQTINILNIKQNIR